MSPRLARALVLVAALAALKVVLAARLGLLADEAYYLCWARSPALGYFDQPPAIAWLLAPVADHPSPVLARLPAIACGALATVVLLPFVGRPVRFAAFLGAPALFGLTFAATPDAPLLLGWSLALAGALAGGPWWLLAGVGAALAVLSKYSGLAVLPLAIAAAPEDWRSRWPFAGAALTALLVAPHLAWSWQNGSVAFLFQLHEGLLHPDPPGVAGPIRWIGDQLGVLTPVLAVAVLGAVALAPRPWDRGTRILATTGLATLGLFLAASPFAPPEAHWPAPAWLSLCVLLARSGPRFDRAADLGSMFAVFGSIWLALGALGAVWVPPSYRDRFAEGALLVDGMRAHALPAQSDPDRTPKVVFTERYQEAAFLRVAGLEAWRVPTCGRPDEFTRVDEPPRVPGLFVRPWRSGPLECVAPGWTVEGGPYELDAIDAVGHRVGRWQVFDLAPAGVP